MKLMYRFFVRRDGEFFHAVLQLYNCRKLDAAKELEENVGKAQEEYHLKRLRFVKSATNGPVYYSKDFGSDAVEFKWQANATESPHRNKPDGRWYAPRVECSFKQGELEILNHLQRRLKKLSEEPDYIMGVSPREILTALAPDKPVHVQYSSSHYDLWYALEHEPENIDKAPVEIEQEA